MIAFYHHLSHSFVILILILILVSRMDLTLCLNYSTVVILLNLYFSLIISYLQQSKVTISVMMNDNLLKTFAAHYLKIHSMCC